MLRSVSITAATIVALFVLAGDARGKDEKENGDHKLPPEVMKTVKHHAAGIRIDDVKRRAVKGHPVVYVIEGDWEDKDVMMIVEEDGDIVEIRYRKHEGEPPKKEAHEPEKLPSDVQKTANRVVPKLKITDVRLRETGSERVYRITGTTTEDDEPRAVVLTIEEDGDLLEARIFKPKKETTD